MEILYRDDRVLVCLKPQGVVSPDEPGGLPELLRAETGLTNIRTVHRLDRGAGGVMVLALTRRAASELSEEIRQRGFIKEYYALTHGAPAGREGRLCDELRRDGKRRVTEAVSAPGADTQTAALRYEILRQRDGLALWHVVLETGRTHQIRCQLSSRGYPIWGDAKYGAPERSERIALWSCRIGFHHPRSGEWLEFTAEPPREAPWTLIGD